MIALCDQRSFYASCESVFRPELRDKPIIVLSNNDGCVVALNEPAKAAGLEKFKPYFQQQQQADKVGATVFSSNYALYGEISKRIMATLAEKMPRIEIYSIDEAFGDLDGLSASAMHSLAEDLRDTVWREQRIPMGVSIAPTKTLAKLGQYATKKIPKIRGICILAEPTQWRWLANRTPASEVWGVGRKLAEKLAERGIHTASDLSQAPLTLVRQIGHKPLQYTVEELNGHRRIPFEWETPARQQIVCSRSFGHKIETLPALECALAEYCGRATERLRRQNSQCRKVSVFVMTSRHSDRCYSGSDTLTLPFTTSDGRIVVKAAKSILSQIYRPGYAYAKTGVMLAGIIDSSLAQQDMWDSPSQKSADVMDVIDSINKKFGRKSVKLCGEGFSAQHAMKQQHLSPRYLSAWAEIPHAHC